MAIKIRVLKKGDASVLMNAAPDGVHYVHPDKAPELWVNEVSIAPAYRGRGLGKAVMKKSCLRLRELISAKPHGC